MQYVHPQGSTITVDEATGAVVKRNKAGKIVSTSATAEKLAAGHGGWTPAESAEPLQDPREHAAAVTRTRGPARRVLIPMRFESAPVLQLIRYVEDPRWWLQQKLDGMRVTLVLGEGPAWIGNSQGQPISNTTAAKFVQPFLRRLNQALPAGTGDTGCLVLDGELVGDRIYVFDAIVPDIAVQPLSDRLKLAALWVQVLTELGLGQSVALIPTARTFEEKRKLAADVMDAGAEGWIAKNPDSRYRWGARVGAPDAVKLKVTHTVDCVVTQRNRDSKANMVLGLWDGPKLVEVGSASAIGKPDAPVGAVVEVKYLYASADDRRLTQPTVLRVRTDKAPIACTLDQLRFADKTVIGTAA